jgi:septal ring-binding cell division protein DamX
MLKLLMIISIATLIGCGRGGASQRGADLPAHQGDWFCQMAENAEDWACVQDPELARSPNPSRLPQPKSSDTALTGNTESTTPVSVAELLDAPATESAPLLSEPPPPPTAAPATELPTYIRLAYQPAAPVPILDMPAEFYAVQLIAMTNRQRLEEYIAINQLEGMTAARTERNGEIYYVLILGIYENRGLAERASLEIPPPLDTTEPWIRELGTLQEAMLRGDALAADAPH